MWQRTEKISKGTDLVYREPGDYPYPAGKCVLALEENSANFSTKGMTEALKIFTDRIEQIGISTGMTKRLEQIKAMESISKKEDD